MQAPRKDEEAPKSQNVSRRPRMPGRLAAKNAPPDPCFNSSPPTPPPRKEPPGGERHEQKKPAGGVRDRAGAEEARPTLPRAPPPGLTLLQDRRGAPRVRLDLGQAVQLDGARGAAREARGGAQARDQAPAAQPRQAQDVAGVARRQEQAAHRRGAARHRGVRRAKPGAVLRVAAAPHSPNRRGPSAAQSGFAAFLAAVETPRDAEADNVLSRVLRIRAIRGVWRRPPTPQSASAGGARRGATDAERSEWKSSRWRRGRQR